MTSARHPTPVLIYDGECSICCEWVAYWRALTGPRVDYRPYQEAAADFPQIAPEAFRGAIQFIDSDGRHCSGAAATFKLYRGIGPWSVLDWVYRKLPGFAAVSEGAYHFFAQRRALLTFLTHFTRGRNFQPPTFRLTSWLFLRVLGFIYLGAMASFAVQAQLLIGSHGILPVGPWLEWLRGRIGDGYWYEVPTLLWLNHSDAFIAALPVIGCVLALAVMVNFATPVALTGLLVIYLSLFYAGQTFMTFQWDLLLLEVGLLAILLTSGSHVVVWLYRWLVFRFVFLGGMVKIASGDPTWRNLTALDYHFETQPLPSPLAWYAHHLPEWLLQTGVAGTLIVELALPFLIFAPRRLRMFAGIGIIAFQSSIVLTGNYNFFNLLTIALCLFLFDDAALRRAMPGFVPARIEAVPARRTRRPTTAIVWTAAAVIVFSSAELLYGIFDGDARQDPSLLTRVITPCRCVNNYGPFAVMTTERNEVVIEGSNDGRNWQDYDFWYKPGDPARAPVWIIPHQPRVDWQLWFAALGDASNFPWLSNLLARILAGNDTVAALFRVNPFPDAPPRYLRASFYRYRFTTPAQRRESGDWWTRERVGLYYPAVRL